MHLPGAYLATIADEPISRWPDAYAHWSDCPEVTRSPDRVSGAWIFRGTRVPVAALFENLESGARLEEFLAWFPGVGKDQAESVLEHAASGLGAL